MGTSLAAKFKKIQVDQEKQQKKKEKEEKEEKARKRAEAKKRAEFKRKHGVEPPPDKPPKGRAKKKDKVEPIEDAKPGSWEELVDLEEVKKLAKLHCTLEEIAAFCEIPVTVLKGMPEVKKAVEMGRDQGKATLRRLQWSAAGKGNISMLIWLGRQYLGQKEEPDSGAVEKEVNITVMDEATAKKMERSDPASTGGFALRTLSFLKSA